MQNSSARFGTKLPISKLAHHAINVLYLSIVTGAYDLEHRYKLPLKNVLLIKSLRHKLKYSSFCTAILPDESNSSTNCVSASLNRDVNSAMMVPCQYLDLKILSCTSSTCRTHEGTTARDHLGRLVPVRCQVSFPLLVLQLISSTLLVLQQPGPW